MQIYFTFVFGKLWIAIVNFRIIYMLTVHHHQIESVVGCRESGFWLWLYTIPATMFAVQVCQIIWKSSKFTKL